MLQPVVPRCSKVDTLVRTGAAVQPIPKALARALHAGRQPRRATDRQAAVAEPKEGVGSALQQIANQPGAEPPASLVWSHLLEHLYLETPLGFGQHLAEVQTGYDNQRCCTTPGPQTPDALSCCSTRKLHQASCNALPSCNIRSEIAELAMTKG